MRRRLLLCLVISAITAGLTLAPASPAAAVGPPLAELVSRGDASSPPRIALTFDAGSDAGFASTILDTLQAKGVKGDFGITGKWAEQNAALVARIAAEGHHIINHTYDHASFTGVSTGAPPLTQAQRWDELDHADSIISAITGKTTKPWFRPPYGDTNASVQADIYADGYGTEVMWTIDSLGWNGLSTSEITTRVLSLAAPGAIVLFHVGSASHDSDALPGIIDTLRARGYSFATVPEILPWRPFPNARALASQQYTDFFNRTAGQSEVDYWSGRLLAKTSTPTDVIASFFASGEFQSTVPPIERLYSNYLLRLADLGGLQYWADKLRQGSSIASVADSMLAFPELQARYGALDDTAFVTALYQNALGRSPDAGGLQFWVGELASHHASRGGVMAALSQSQESVARSASQTTVATVYLAMLRRTPDAGGLAFWSQFLDTHPVANLVGSILVSDEYRARFSSLS